jgi:type I restriction enzyme S subunit
MKQGWELKRLDDLCQIKTGKKDVNQGNLNGKYPFFTCAREHTFSDSFSFDTEALLIAGNGDVGNVSYFNGKFEAYQRTYVLFDFVNILPRFLFLILDGTLKKSMANQKLGNTMPYIKLGMLKEFEIPLPSILEQERIVAILDEAFAAIAIAKANNEQNLKNAKELFESYLQGVFENKDEGWEEKSLGEIATFRNGMNFTKSSKGEKINIVGVKDFQNSFWVPFETLETVVLDGKLNEFDLLREGDILAVRSNGNPQLIGRTLLASKVEGKVSHSGFTIRIRLNAENIDPIYLCSYLKIPKTRKILVDGGNGVGIKSLNQGSLSALIIPFPKSLKEQQTVIQKLDALSTEIKKLEANYQQKINDLEELKKSVSQKAFSGELKTEKVLV